MTPNIPFLTDKDIEVKADHFRTEYFGTKTPFNPEEVWDCVLKKEIRLYKNLKIRTGIEAALSLNFEAMLIDEESFRIKKYPGRLAFSMSHELGHYHLHRQCLSELKLSSTSLWKFWLETIHPQVYNRLEYQADKFAAFLLMPAKEVTSASANFTKYLLTDSPLKDKVDFSDPSFRRYYSSNIAADFNVSGLAMEIRLAELGLWPDH